MHQLEIWEKIEELIKLNQDSKQDQETTHRQEDIIAELMRATASYDKKAECFSLDDKSAVIRGLLESLIIKTLENRPEALRGLFPLLAFTCTDRAPNSLISSEVFWELMDDQPD